jgi:hypothetical protein
LRGLGGITLALPALEIFSTSVAKAAPAPFRYVVAFAGSSLGMDSVDAVTPGAEGPWSGALTRGLQPLADAGVSDAASFVSGLKIPWGADDSIPAGGRRIQFHSTTPCPMLCGVRSDPNTEALQGPTSDWIVANTIGGPTLSTRPVLTYRVQPSYYRGSNGTGGDRGIMSARMNGSDLEKVPPQFSPKIAFQDLITGFVPPDPAEALAAKFLLDRRKSVIDLVATDTEALLPKLGSADKQRMTRHFDELRALENKLNAVALPESPSCKAMTDPGDDPPMGNAVENGDTAGYEANGAWSDEEVRASLMIDLIYMAFVCDMSRVASLMFTYAQCFMNTNPIFGYPSDLHELSHFSVGGAPDGSNAVADGVSWHVKHIANLMQRLKGVVDVDGSSVLDNTALVLLFEGGLGYDPEQDKPGSAHSSENMGVLVGGLAGGLNQSGGKHIRAQDSHPAQVINTVMQALGVPQELGEVSGTIPGLVG